MKLHSIFILIICICFVGCQKEIKEEIKTELSISPNELLFEDIGGMQTIYITANKPWAITSSADWCEVSSLKGESNEKISITCTENGTGDIRNCTITVSSAEKSQTIAIVQYSNQWIIPSQNKFELSKEEQIIDIEINANVDYDVYVDEHCKSWISQVSSKTVSSNTLSFRVAENNTYDSREGKIKVSQVNGTLSADISIRQIQLDGLFVEQNEYELSEVGQILNVKVKSNIEFDVKIDETCSWLSIVTTKSLAESNVGINVEANPSQEPREGNVIFRQMNGPLYETVTIKQKAKEAIRNIIFKDPAAKYACVERFDTNNDGEVSEDEALAATSLDGLFDKWRSIESFDEIAYFKNVTALNRVFFNCSKLCSIIIPSNITVIGENAFRRCSSLKSIQLPPTITIIGTCAFSECSNLSTISLPSTLIEIGYGAFQDCSNLTAIELPASLRLIGSGAFSGCHNLNRIDIPYGIQTIPRECFHRCWLLSAVTIPNTVISIESGAFYDVRNLWNIDLPESVTEIHPNGICSKCVTIRNPEKISLYDESFVDVQAYFVPSGSIEKLRYMTVWTKVKDKIHPIELFKEKSQYQLCTSGAVDMGLSVKWSASNLGAKSPEETGYYYAWGETNNKKEYTEANYKWISEDGKFTKYVPYNEKTPEEFFDNKMNIEREDDAAYINLGAGWKIPTSEEFIELVNGCIWEDNTINDISVSMVYGIGSGNIIILPSDNYWTSTLRDYASRPDLAMYLRVWQGKGNVGSDYNSHRFLGHLIRPVLQLIYP